MEVQFSLTMKLEGRPTVCSACRSPGKSPAAKRPAVKKEAAVKRETGSSKPAAKQAAKRKAGAPACSRHLAAWLHAAASLSSARR